MLRNITKEQEEILNLLEYNSSYKKCLDSISNDKELLSILLNLINNKDVYTTYLKKISEDRELEEQMGILSTFKFMEYIRDNGFDRLLRFIDDLSKKSILTTEKKIEYVERVFAYIDFLVYRDEINDTVSGKRMREDAIEALKELKYLIEEEKLTDLINKNEILSSENEKLIEENDRLTDENDNLTTQNINLNNTNTSLAEQRDGLKSELDLLNNQIENRRLVLQSGLDEEISASRVKRMSNLDDEIDLMKKNKTNEIVLLEKRKLEIQSLIDKLEKNLEKIKQDMNNMPTLFSSRTAVYDVIWEPVNSKHILYSQNYLTIKDFAKKIKMEYMFKTGKTEEECEKDFKENSPYFDEFIRLLHDRFTNEDVIEITSLSRIIKCFNWSEESKIVVQKLKSLLNQLKLPTYKKRSNINSISNFGSNDFQLYLMNLEFNSKLAEATMKAKIMEAKYISLVSAVKDFIPEGYDFGSYEEVVDIEDTYRLERKRP